VTKKRKNSMQFYWIKTCTTIVDAVVLQFFEK